MKQYLSIFLLGTLISVAHGQNCTDKVLDVSTLNTGEARKYKWINYPIVVFKGSFANLPEPHSFEKQGLIPHWWATDIYPINLELMQSDKRRLADNISVFWSPSPSYGCDVLYFPPYKTAKEPGRTPYFVGKDWGGGYIDLCYMHAFNTLGQLVAIDQKHKTKAPRIIMDLLIPTYKVLKNGDIELKCHPNTSLKRDLANRSAA